MPKLYGSMLCSDCVDAVEYLSNIGYRYDFVDINEDIASLKEFIVLRDSREEFESFKLANKIGIPAMLLDDGRLLLVDEVLKLN